MTMAHKRSVAGALVFGGAVALWSSSGAIVPRAAATQDQSPQAPLTFRSSADAVMLSVSVRRRDRPVTGLRAEDFHVFDNGVPQQIADFSYETLPVDVTVVLDVSASVTGRVLADLQRAIGRLRADLGEGDRLKLMTFNMRVRRQVDFTASADAIDASFGAIRPFGSSAVLDAVAVALASPAPADRRQLVVLFSDGEDSSSITEPGVLFEVVRRTSPTIAVVVASPPTAQTGAAILVPNTRTGLVMPSAGQTPMRLPAMHLDLYRALATETGGRLLQINPRDNLSSAFRRILDDFRSSYVLHFVPAGVATGGVHTLDVQVDREGVEVRTRTEYEW
jgi:VWFA-related protein